jgi:hypothetical protein
MIGLCNATERLFPDLDTCLENIEFQGLMNKSDDATQQRA